MTSDNNEELTEIKTNIAVILERTKILPDIDRRTRVIEQKQEGMFKDIRHNEDDIKDLQTKSNTWDFLNSIGAIIALIVGSIFGTGK